MAPAAPLPRPLRMEPGERFESVCGTRPGAGAEIVSAHLARVVGAPLPTPHSTDAGEIAVLEDDGSFFFSDPGHHNHVDLASVTNAFYRTHGDDYDAISVWLSSGLTDWLGSPTAFAAEISVRNLTQGIGLDLFDVGTGFGSPARLLGVLSMNGLLSYPANPDTNLLEGELTPLEILGHELGHLWSSYVYVDSGGSPSPALLGRDRQHWNFFLDTDASYMDGCDWVSVGPDSFFTDSVTTGYGRLDLYVMGLMSASEIDSFVVVNDPHDFDPPGNYVPAYPPLNHLGCRGRPTWWHVSDIEAVHGPRVPDAASAPHAFRMAFILVTANGNAATPADLSKLETMRSRFPGTFAYATRGRGTLDASLDSRAGRVCIAHTPLPDTETPLASRPVGCRVTIAQAGIPIALDPASVAALWRPAGGGGWTRIPLAPVAPDSFAGSLPPLPSDGGAEYVLVAASDSAGIDATDPPAGTSAPHVYQAGPDLAPPTIAHVPVRRQAARLLPQTLLARVTDNLGVDSVWVEVVVDGGTRSTVGAVRVGADSFAVSLGEGLVQDQRLAYQFRARDAAAARNLSAPGAADDTLLVGRNWLNDFENGAERYLHTPGRYSYRDAWHLAQEQSSPPGGTAWKCGAGGEGAYPPHLDSSLLLPTLTDLVPGTLLLFDHAYDLEQADASTAWDGARLEGVIGGSGWQVMTPAAGYTHTYLSNSSPFERGTACWSGHSGGWRTEIVDLTALAPGPAVVRFHMLADDYIGFGGWYVDHVRILYPGTAGVPSATGPLTISRPWPNPARSELRLSVSLSRETRGEWSLYDVSGRRVADLWKGVAGPGGFEMRGSLARLPAGLYFSRLMLDGREAATARIALVR